MNAKANLLFTELVSCRGRKLLRWGNTKEKEPMNPYRLLAKMPFKRRFIIGMGEMPETKRKVPVKAILISVAMVVAWAYWARRYTDNEDRDIKSPIVMREGSRYIR